MNRHISRLHESAGVYSKIMKDSDTSLLESLFNRGMVNSILGLVNPYDHFKVLKPKRLENDNDFLVRQYYESGWVLESTDFFVDANESKEKKDSVDSNHENNVDEDGNEEDREFVREAEEEAERVYYSTLMKLYA